LEKIRESEKASNKGSEGDYESEEKLDKLAGLSGDQSVSALRPLGYTYFQTRVFGVISSVPGLSNVFRGGLLPRTDSGRAIALLGPAGIGKTVFALQILADIARFGGLSVYLSFEESYDSIVDRLVTFGLWDHFKFQVKRAGDDLTQVIQKAQAQEEEHGKGLLIFYEPGDAAGTTLPDIIDTIGQSVANWEGFKALAIDSVNSLPLPFGSFPEGIDESIVRIEPWKLYGPPSERLSEESRSYLYDSIVRIEHWKLYGILLGEKDGRYYRVLPYLADTVIELGSDENARTRWLEIKKCRVQDYHEGRHPFRLLDSRGAIIYPSLASRRSSLRGRVRSTLSQHRVILYPSPPERGRPKNLTPDLVIPEKSATLIWGPQGSGKTLVALKLLTGASTLRKKEGTGSSWSGNRFDLWTPQNVMVITFRASEKNFEQSLRNQKDLASKWKRIQQNWVRWYSPGSNLTAEQIVAEIWRYFKDSRRKGVPVDRILFDETEVAADVLPALQRDSLFWPTILELTSTEAATSFFVCESVNEEQSAMRVLRASMDNILYVRREESDGKPYRRIEVVQHSERVPLRSQIDEPLDLQAQAATPQNPEKKAAVPKQVEVPPAE
jgi:KaiC/GvpD/RAD55 family RecA-like ATPase